MKGILKKREKELYLWKLEKLMFMIGKLKSTITWKLTKVKTYYNKNLSMYLIKRAKNHWGCWGLPTYFEVIQEEQNLGQKYIKKYKKKVQEWKKWFPDYPLCRWKRKMEYVVGKIHGKTSNQGIPCPTNRY